MLMLCLFWLLQQYESFSIVVKVYVRSSLVDGIGSVSNFTKRLFEQ